MNRLPTIALTLLGLASTAFLPPTATAAIVDGSLVTVTRPKSGVASAPDEYSSNAYAYGGALLGGEFRITENGGGEVFKTFCLEYSENISLGGTYIGTVEGGAILGGVDGAAQSHYDPISNATKWFYAMYRESQLDNLISGFKYNDDQWANALQLVFWRLEGEMGSINDNDNFLYVASNNPINDNANALWSYYLNENNRAGIDNYVNDRVQVLNLWKVAADDNGKPFHDPANYAKLDNDATFRGTLESYKAQSQLYYAPLPPGGGGSPVVPEPTSMVAWASLACLGLVAARRRKLAQPAA